MNQIIYTSRTTSVASNIEVNKNFYFKKKKFFKLLYYVLIFSSFSITIFYIFYRCNILKSEKISQKILQDYNITSIYSKNNNYTTNLSNTNASIFFYNNMQSSVIGIIEIKKINIVYPILSQINKDLLKISPCRFYGPNPNEIGNICIAAHNYKNDTFFSNISLLVNGDIVTIYDNSGGSTEYIVYKVYKTLSNDISCINQNTNNSKIVTLVTCDTIDNHYRTIVKAKEI